MMMTWRPTPVPDEEAFAAIKAGIDSLPPGVKVFLNSGAWAPLTSPVGRWYSRVSPQASSMGKTC